MNADLRDLYQEVILDHNRRPRNRGKIEDATHDAEGHNPLCGDQVHVWVRVDEQGRVEDIRFDGHGCAISTASASLMTEAIRGLSLEDSHALFQRFHQMLAEEGAEIEWEEERAALGALSGVKEFPARVKCATLAWHTLEAALNREREPVNTEQA